MQADLAQLVERVAFNHVVVGSSPTVGEFACSLFYGEILSILARLLTTILG